MLSEIEDLARRLEQQLTAYERMHLDELKNLQEQLATFQRLQHDEMQMLRDELSQLKQELAAYKKAEPERQQAAAVDAASTRPVELGITRRELITRNLPFNTKRA
ncbi:MAG: hypothetical protein HZB51_02515 [Chloroflexi bacterium]|nr:hypothetical protein [Chloroflexota bacterium]